MTVNTTGHTRTLSFVILVAVLLPAALTRAQRAESPESMLQRAVQKEVVEGDPKAAIDLYKQIVDAPRASEAVKAQAMLNTGRSHHSLGNDAGARAAYERVIEDFRGQSAAVSDAQARLVALGAAAPGTAVAVRDLTRLPISDTRLAAVSPDGRYVYTAAGTVFDQVTRRYRQIPRDERSIFEVAFSADGAQVAYELGRVGGEIRVVSLRTPEGTDGTVIFRNEEYRGGKPFGWSPDGKHVFAVLTRKDGTYVIAAISTSDRTFRPIKSLDWRWPTGLSLSPDGRYISYDIPLAKESIDRDIFVLSTDGRLEVPLVEGPGRDAGPVWTPDGRAVVFASDREGTPGLWMIEVADGQPRGTAVNLRSNETLRPIGFTRDGVLYYVRATGTAGRPARLSTVDVDWEVETGSRSETPIDSSGLLASYSPDSTRLAYVSLKPPTFAGPYPFEDSLPSVVVRTLSTGEEKEIPAAQIDSLAWMPDGKSIVFLGRLHSDPVRKAIHRIDLDTGKDLMGQVPGTSTSFTGPLTVSPDGKTIYYLTDVRVTPDTWGRAIVAYDVDTQRETELHRGDLEPVLAASPDGQIVFQPRRRVAEVLGALAGVPGASTAMMPGQLHTMSTSGGVPRELAELTLKGGETLVQWHGGKGLLAQRGGDLWSVPLDGGAPKRVGKDRHPRIVSLRPDGKQMVVAREPARGAVAENPGALAVELWADPHALPNHERSGMFLADIDRAGTRVRGTVTSLSPSLISPSMTPTWSPDGRSIAFQRRRADGTCERVVLSIGTGVERVYQTSLQSGRGGGPACSPFAANAATWFHDSRGFLLRSSAAFVRLPLDGQASRELAKAVADGSGPSALSNDDTILYAVAPASNPPHIVVVDLATGTEKRRLALPASASVSRVRAMTLSPDGRTLALSVDAGLSLGRTRIVRIGTDGKDYRELFRQPEGNIPFPTRPVWSGDGSAVLIGVSPNVSPMMTRIMRIPADGGGSARPTFTGLEVTDMRGFDLNPDGTRIVFEGRAPTISTTAR